MISLRRLAYFVSPYRWYMILGFFTVVLPVAMELVVPRALQYIIDDGIRANNMGAIWQGALFMFAAAFVGAIMAFAQGWCRAAVSQGVAFDLRNTLFAHIQSFSFANLDQMQTGRLMTRVSSDVDTLRMFSSANLALLLRTSLMVVGSFAMLLWTNWRLSMIVVVLLIIAMFLLRILMRVAQPLFVKVQSQLGALNTTIQENLAGIQVVKAFVREKFEIDRFSEANLEYRDQNIFVGRILATGMPTLMILTNLGIVSIIWLGGSSVIEGRMSVGELVAFNNYLIIGMMPLLFLSNLLTMVSRAEASAGRVLEVLDTKPAIPPVTTATSTIGSNGKPAVSNAPQRKMKGQITFTNVSFRYALGESHLGERTTHFADRSIPVPTPAHVNGTSPGRIRGAQQEDVLDNISFTVEAGEQIAILGATGSGKSSLVQLIPRFYDVTQGSIQIDGLDVREWPLEQLRSQISMVMQQPLLFSGTVRENIAYGRSDATMEEVIAAAKSAQAHDFVSAMPDGYESHIESQGANLSGGQRQRIAIARALLVSPAILVLDDSTSAVDYETEIKIQDALETARANCTVLLIAQRISSVLNANQILILDQGQIVARGTHAELLESSQIYREIYESQMGEMA